jgi:hypothetical protein
LATEVKLQSSGTPPVEIDLEDIEMLPSRRNDIEILIKGESHLPPAIQIHFHQMCAVQRR